MAVTLRESQSEEPPKRPQGRVLPDPLLSLCNVATLGFGTVGQAVAERLCCGAGAEPSKQEPLQFST